MRKLMWFSLGFGAACALGAYFFSNWLWIVAVVALLISITAAFLQKRWNVLKPIVALALGVSLGICWVQIYDTLYLQTARSMDGETICVTVTASDYSYQTEYGAAVKGVISFDEKEYKIQLYYQGEETLSPGDTIKTELRLRYTAGEEATYHAGNGIFLLGYADGEATVTKAQSVPIRFYPALLRQKLISAIDTAFPQSTAFFAKALLLGDRTGVDYATNTAFKVSGISHIIAVSGLHVSILFSLVYLFAGKRRVLTAILGIPTVLLFAAVAGFTPSITRACLMQILMMLALLFDKEYDPATALSFAVLVILAVNPLTITAAGFQLSAGCMVGIFLFSGRIQTWIQNLAFWSKWKGKSLRVRFRQWLSGGISVTLSAMFFTTPLVATYFGSVSLIGILTNLLTLWVITFIFYGIMAVCLLSFVWTGGAAMLAWVISIPIYYVLWIAKILSSIPLAAVYIKSVYVLLWLVLCYVLIFVLMTGKKRQPTVCICCCVLSLCVVLGCSWLEPLLDGCRMTVLDVGQGQCILLQGEGKTYLVDCGGDSDTAAADVAAETLLSMGICRLDGVIVTHFDRDHAGGVGYLLTRIPADAVYLPATHQGEEGILPRILENGGRAIRYVETDTLLSWGETELTIFAPVLFDSDNESGLTVLFHRENCDILITGDLSSLGEELLIRQKPIPKLTALVAGHHGAKTSMGEALLAATQPQNVFISVGADNSFGHPAAEVLERLRIYGCTVYRTDENGTILFRR